MSVIDPGIEAVNGQTGQAPQAEDLAQACAKDDEDQEDEEEEFLESSGWWFASTACPLLAATFGPMANAFSICALSSAWRMHLPPDAPDQAGVPIPDPSWAVVINAVSLAAAILGNISLLLNMAHRISFSIAQPVSIASFLLAGILLIADMVALTVSAPDSHRSFNSPHHGGHELTAAFYFALFAAAIHVLIGSLMSLTMFGASRGYYRRDFRLTPSQRTLMLQTMIFFAYLLLSALVFSHIESWQYLTSVYWADVTLLTIGLGDFSPKTRLGHGLLFPFAICGILIVGLMVSSIRSLVLERGSKKLSARIAEKRRACAVHDVDDRRQTIRISIFARADFSIDPELSPAQRRKEEFDIMRKVQKTAEREARWFGLATSTAFALTLWLVGAAVFMQCEFRSDWTYFQAVYFSYTSLLTVGYGDLAPRSGSGRAFFVLWSLLAIPSLTILISNMGDTIVVWFSDFATGLGSLTVLPDDKGFRNAFHQVATWATRNSRKFFAFLCGPRRLDHEKRMERSEYEKRRSSNLSQRLSKHLRSDDFSQVSRGRDGGEKLQQDLRFYHFVLARESKALQKTLALSPTKKYDWAEWEYYLLLMGSDRPRDSPCPPSTSLNINHSSNPVASGGVAFPTEQGSSFSSRLPADTGSSKGAAKPYTERKPSIAQSTTQPESVYSTPLDGNVDRRTSVAQHLATRRRRRPHPTSPDGEPEPDLLATWSWLSDESPLMVTKTETEWILSRLSAVLERELSRQLKGETSPPPIGMDGVP